jgi:hypothetical protein
MFSLIRRQLNELSQTEIQILAVGNYPDKRATKVSDVAHYQNDGTENDGTEKIKPSRFVERAAEAKQEWHRDLHRAIGKFLDGKEEDLTRVGRIIARDITNKCDRIRTTRLKYSFRNLILK